jgi:hypothetical protein
MLGDAMGKVGYVAPVTVAADGEALDGSARLEIAFDKFGDEAIVVRHDGTKPIVMVREDIPNASTPEAKQIAYGANRIAQVDYELDAEQAYADMEAGLDLSDLYESWEVEEIVESALMELEDVGEVDNKRQLGDATRMIKPVLYAEQVTTFERALLATGKRSRGEALITVCQEYLERHGGETGQFDADVESILASALTERD